MTMENNLYKAYAEIAKILEFLEDEYLQKIPDKLINLFEQEKLKDYDPIIDPNISLNKQNLQKKTFVLLAIINLNYWVETEEEREALIKIYKENDIVEEKIALEKYPIDNLFKNKSKTTFTSNSIENSIITYQEKNFFVKILDKMISLFKHT